MTFARTISSVACLTFVAGCAIDTGGLRSEDARPATRDAGARTDAATLDASRDGASEDAGTLDASRDGASEDAGPPTVEPDGGPPDGGCGGPESCSAPLDEDCDGIVDEGCEWHFGRPSPVVRLHRSEGAHYSPVLSRDGRRLYYYAQSRDPSAFPAGAIYVARRADVADRFGPPEVVGGFADVTPYSFTLDDAELEIIFEGQTSPAAATRLFRAARATRTDPFGPREPLAVLDSPTATTRELNPALTRDGLELFFASDRSGSLQIHRAIRSAPDAPFGPPEQLDLGTGLLATPRPTRDGRTLFLSHDWEIWAATRPTLDGPFGLPVPVADLPRDGNTYFPFVAQETSEIWFISERAWSPAAISIWRARVCRDGPCSEPTVACPGGTTSADGRHCYFAPSSTPATFAGARSACEAEGATLASLHSVQERGAVLPYAGVQAWIGGTDAAMECNVTIPGCLFEWVTGEPWLYAPFRAGEPNNAGGSENCITVESAVLNDTECDRTLGYVCERELWPW